MNILFADLTDIVIDGGTSTTAWMESAYHKVWKRDLTEAECEWVTTHCNRDLYEEALNQKF